MRVPVNEPVITDEAKRNVLSALETGWISSAGAYIGEFENAFASYLGVKHAIATTSGTTALHVALAALDIGPGDEVIVPDFTMIASVYAVLYTGATPVFIDAEPETFCLDTTKLPSLITERTKAIMPVHLFGHPADMDPVLTLAQERGIAVVEDAAEVHGALYKGRLCGSMGDLGCFSFYGNKIITTGEGGMVVTNDDALARRVRSLKDLAHVPGKRFTHEAVGFNYRMTNLQAGLGLGQLQHIDAFLAHKRWMGETYTQCLKEIRGLRTPITKVYATNVYWMYALLVEDEFGISRDALCERLKEREIDTRDFFLSSAKQPSIRALGIEQGPFPVSEDLARRGFYLPSGLALTQEQLDYVCASIEAIAHDVHH
ncbi:aminotransferase DegT [Candidatus Peregrinibacteria bacterium CG10_big_fil_rev_8_21_14_0_10_55_24]|nr:MAG: aminotransferase DegT [Candidatus Peregrinibacteria bacterium CG10_big_fil_rev_8_21_14_0_10_55_24]